MKCPFPAKELIALRRDLATHPNIATHDAVSLIAQIDRMRWEHSTSGCNCWSENLAPQAGLFDRKTA